MALKLVLCFVALAAFTQATFCPTFSCDTGLADNVCATYVSSSAFKLNANGCKSGSYCSALDVASWAAQLNLIGSTTSASSPCVAESSSTTTGGNWTPVSCGVKLPNKKFKSGQSVIACTADTDCILTDGTNTKCMCIFKVDGSGICDVHNSNDQVFGDYWNDCGSSSIIEDEDTYAYWEFYRMYWEYTQSTVVCMNIFVETAMLEDLFDAYDGASTLLVGAFSLLALY